MTFDESFQDRLEEMNHRVTESTEKTATRRQG
jgi:hypothetical protein